MVQQMAQTPQPSFLSSWLAAFGRFDAAHGWAVNLFVVVALAFVGASFLSARPRSVRAAVIVGTVLGLADWVLVQDLGFLGGVGTDPNSMVPTILLFIAGYLALTRAPAVEDSSVVVPIAVPKSSGNRWGRLVANPTYTFRAIAATGAIGVTLIGAVPLAAAATAPSADLILAQALDGPPKPSTGRRPRSTSSTSTEHEYRWLSCTEGPLPSLSWTTPAQLIARSSPRSSAPLTSTLAPTPAGSKWWL